MMTRVARDVSVKISQLVFVLSDSTELTDELSLVKKTYHRINNVNLFRSSRCC